MFIHAKQKSLSIIPTLNLCRPELVTSVVVNY